MYMSCICLCRLLILAGIYNNVGRACCDRSCGKYCGAIDCQDGPSGAAACCPMYIEKICTATVTAPCKLNPLEHYSKAFTPVTTHCKDFGGIDHPEGEKCCDIACGKECGAAHCGKASPGPEGCCSSKVSGTYCSLTKEAPCMLTAPPPEARCRAYGGTVHPLK